MLATEASVAIAAAEESARTLLDGKAFLAAGTAALSLLVAEIGYGSRSRIGLSASEASMDPLTSDSSCSSAGMLFPLAVPTRLFWLSYCFVNSVSAFGRN